MEDSGMNKRDQTAVYRIRVWGELEPRWLHRFGGMEVTLVCSCEDGLVTTLEGRMENQAALSGVLESLYELHRLVLDVKRLDNRKN